MFTSKLCGLTLTPKPYAIAANGLSLVAYSDPSAPLSIALAFSHFLEANVPGITGRLGGSLDRKCKPMSR